MASPAIVSVFIGLAIGTILYFMFGNNQERNSNSAHSYEYNR